jgi:hypothetical protein
MPLDVLWGVGSLFALQGLALELRLKPTDGGSICAWMGIVDFARQSAEPRPLVDDVNVVKGMNHSEELRQSFRMAT